MAARLMDAEIAALLAERKVLPADYQGRIKLKAKRGHREREVDVAGVSGHEFRVLLRQSMFNPLDFSVILVHRAAEKTDLFRLRRYNGKSHEHSNSLENQTFYDFHIHTATERYQELGGAEDTFAEPTSRFADMPGAIRCLLDDCGFDLPPGHQAALFEEER